MTARPKPYAKYVSGDLSTGQLFLIREDGSRAVCSRFVIFRGVSLTDNSDSTFDLNFDAS